MEKFVIGIDYGTDSVRSVIINTKNGEEQGSAVFEYPRWKEAKYCDASVNQFRQHPLDYLEGLEHTVKEAIRQAPAGTAEKIAAISIDTTGSTPVAVDQQGTPLALQDGFHDNPNAMFILWKDHTAVAEADHINEVARNWGGTDFTKFEGGIYSSEWFWAKILHVLRADDQIGKKAYSWLEHCDWIPALLTGITDVHQIKRSRCAAGHKAMWHPSWGGLPEEEFLVKLDPKLKGLRERLYQETYTSDQAAGTISEEWAQKLGIPSNVIVGVGAFDAHLGAVGAEIKPNYLSKVMGTSTCDMLITSRGEIGDKLVKGICGQVDGSISPEMIGLEAGQSAFGDIYAWFRQVLSWPVDEILTDSDLLDNPAKMKLKEELKDKMIAKLSLAASKLPVKESDLVSLDWMNGRRTPDANQKLEGMIMGLTLGTDAPQIFKALVEATAFGAKRIVERFIREGIRIDGVIALGGVARKSEYVMQTVANVLNMPIKVAKNDQACALGSAMAASVAAEIHKDFATAQDAMGSGFEKEYYPDTKKANTYQILYQKYLKLGDLIEENFYSK